MINKHIAAFAQVVCLTFLFGCDSSDGENVVDERTQPKVVAWLMLSERSSANRRLLTGVVKAAERTRLSFQAQGQVEKISVKVGEHFKKGQVLAVLDTTNYRLQLQQAQAQLNTAIAQRNQARTEVKRREKLVQSKAVSKSQLDAFRLQQASAQQSINAATARVGLAKKQLADTALIAPFDGSVTDQFVEVAQLVGPEVPVFGVEADRVPEVSFSIPENMIAHLSVGDSAAVVFSALPHAKAHGVIAEISSQAQIGAFPATLALNNPSHAIKAGMSAEILLLTTAEKNKREFVIPPSALGAAADDQHFVYRIAKEKSQGKYTLEKVRVEVIDFFDDSLGIVGEHLRAGDRIVRGGLSFLTPQQRVSLMGEGASTINP